jgi:tRNA (guanine37-N1)-methyltransferase
MRIDVITIFPKIFDNFLKESLIGKAQKEKIIEIKVHNLRDFCEGKRKNVDDAPYGGGPGMVFKIEPIFKAVTSLIKYDFKGKKLIPKEKSTKIIVFTPRGKIFDQKTAFLLSKMKRLILICPRYEGVDERVIKYISNLALSIGPYDLMGGEVPAMVLIEAVCRLVPGVVKNPQLLKERIKNQRFFEYPVFTRPAVFSPKKGIFWEVPKILLSGDHKKIEAWRKKYGKIIG